VTPKDPKHQQNGAVDASTVPSSSSNIAELWQRIRANGPLPEAGTFDPLTVDDVLQAERAQMQYERRKAFVAAFSWAIPTPEAIDAIIDSLGERRLLEVGAGAGLWASLLADRGADVTATDAAPPPHVHFGVETRAGLSAVETYADCDALMLCWPPFKDSLACKVLKAFDGDRLVEIGDPRFTADAAFRSLIQIDWVLDREEVLPSWPGTSDALRIHHRA
jgi:hypothetical protein